MVIMSVDFPMTRFCFKYNQYFIYLWDEYVFTNSNTSVVPLL